MTTPQMTLLEARRVLLDQEVSYGREVEAAAAISNSKHATLDDLLACLARGGLPAELAAMALYQRTGRARVGSGVTSFVTDPQDWVAYLKQEGSSARSA